MILNICFGESVRENNRSVILFSDIQSVVVGPVKLTPLGPVVGNSAFGR